LTGFIYWLVVTLLLFGVGIGLAYRREELRPSTLILGIALFIYSLISGSWLLWLLALWAGFAALVALNFDDFRRERITAPLLRMYRTMVPEMSSTEREALDAGTVWWEGELFTGRPDWSRLTSLPPARLSEEEKAFLDGPTEELCRLLKEWEVTHELADMPKAAWDFILKERFFGMIIPPEYGGLGFSPFAVASVLARLSGHSTVAASTIGVPNSLGPAELLMHYGTDEQKQHYLPKLASGKEIPCFALTSPRVGSDASAITDSGVVCKGEWEGAEVIGIRLNWDKRYITLAPIATVLGLAFKLSDPDHLIGDQDEYGITAALIPTSLPGVETGRRHFPLNIPFQNGPTSGKDVFVPLDAIIGGPERAGQGWKMLVELLSAGRAIVLPANSMGGAQAAVWNSGAYTRVRRQFGLPICRFEGVGEALGRMAGNAYIINAAVSVTTTAIARGEKPAVPSAILKYHCTELARTIAADAMDVQGGKGIMLGPKNYLGRGYQAMPIAITVEGANILTRSLIIFGQGAVRCHPFVLKEMAAANEPDFETALRDFDQHLFGHVGFAVSNAARALVLALTHARVTPSPVGGPTARYYQHINRYSAAREDLPLVEWACRSLLYRAQEQLHGLLRNLPNRAAAAALRLIVFPRGRTYFAPSDELGQQIVELITHPTKTRARLCRQTYVTPDPDNAMATLQQGLVAVTSAAPLYDKLRSAVRAGLIGADDPVAQIDAAEREGVLTAAEAEQMRALDAMVMDIIGVDDFDSSELGTKVEKPRAPRKKRTTKKSATKRSAASSNGADTASPS
jgi:acyl-CoA dehydrogenase